MDPQAKGGGAFTATGTQAKKMSRSKEFHVLSATMKEPPSLLLLPITASIEPLLAAEHVEGLPLLTNS